MNMSDAAVAISHQDNSTLDNIHTTSVMSMTLEQVWNGSTELFECVIVNNIGISSLSLVLAIRAIESHVAYS